MGLFVSSGGAGAALLQGINFFQGHQLLEPSLASFLKQWAGPPFAALLLYGAHRFTSRRLEQRLERIEARLPPPNA